MFTKKTDKETIKAALVHKKTDLFMDLVRYNPHFIDPDLLSLVIMNQNKSLIAFLIWIKPQVLKEECGIKIDNTLRDFLYNNEDLLIFINKMSSWYFPKPDREDRRILDICSCAKSVLRRVVGELERTSYEQIQPDEWYEHKIKSCVNDLNTFIRISMFVLQLCRLSRFDLFQSSIIFDRIITRLKEHDNLHVRLYNEPLFDSKKGIFCSPEFPRGCPLEQGFFSETLTKISRDHNVIALIHEYKTSRKYYFGTVSSDTKIFMSELEELLKLQPEKIPDFIENFIKNRFAKNNYSEEFIIPLLLTNNLLTREKIEGMKDITLETIGDLGEWALMK